MKITHKVTSTSKVAYPVRFIPFLAPVSPAMIAGAIAHFASTPTNVETYVWLHDERLDRISFANWLNIGTGTARKSTGHKVRFTLHVKTV